MKVKQKEFTETTGLLEIEGTALYFVNAIRRALISEVPKLAIDDVIIYDNNSALFDEIIAHRLSLIPIPTDLKLLTFRENCTCDGAGCPNCTVRYTLSKEGESTVYSGDLTPESKDLAIKNTTIPIVELGKDQRIILEVEAILGRGRTHAKWQSVQVPGYRMATKITINDKDVKEVKEFLKDIPKGIAELKGTEIILSDPAKLPVLESYVDRAEADFLNIQRDPTHLTLTLETDGALTAEAAVKEAVNILIEKFDDFSKELKKFK